MTSKSRSASAPPGQSVRGKKVAVTGASGFIGRYLVRALQSRGVHTIAIVRNPRKVPTFAHAENVEVRRADLTDRTALTSALQGAHALVHNAAVISIGRRSRQELLETNTAGTRNVMEAAAECGVTSVVMTSSAMAYQPVPDHVYRVGDPTWRDDDNPRRTRYYGLSKAAAERVAKDVADAHQVSLTIARPHQVFGAFDRGSFTRYFKLLMKPPVTVWFTHVELPSVYAGDLAEAMIRMLESPSGDSRVYNVAGEESVSWCSHLRAWQQAGGPRRIVIPIPVPVRRVLDPGPLGSDFGWRPRPLQDAFRETLQLEQGLTPAHDPLACGQWELSQPSAL